MTTRAATSGSVASAETGISAAAASARGWDVYAIALEDDPHLPWRRMRESTPVFDAGGGVYFVTRWEQVDEVLRDPRHLAGAGVAASFGAETGLVFDVMRAWLMSLDGPPQSRARGLVRREFTPRKIETLRPAIRSVAEQLVASIEERALTGPVDLVPTLAFALPCEIIRMLFGFSEAEWQRDFVPLVRDVDPSPRGGIAMIEGLARQFDERLHSGRIPDGLLEQLCRPDAELGALTPLEVVANSVLLVTAAIDTTAGLIGNAIACLLERRELLARVRERPALVASAIEETLRFEPSALSCSRTAGYDFVLGGVPIAAGSQLLLSIGAANRDPLRFPEPDRFMLERDTTGITSFGGGRHFCLGAALARLEAQVVVERLLIESELDFALADGARWQKRNPTIRAHESLPVTATRHASARH